MDVLGMYTSLLSISKSQTAKCVVSYTELNQVKDREIGLLSGGELQRFAIGLVCVQKADV